MLQMSVLTFIQTTIHINAAYRKYSFFLFFFFFLSSFFFGGGGGGGGGGLGLFSFCFLFLVFQGAAMFPSAPLKHRD